MNCFYRDDNVKMPNHNRRQIRLRNYDYSGVGSYFITICTHDKKPLFGKIVDGDVVLNELGEIVQGEWIRSIEIRKEIDFDKWVIMPNHIHGIVIISSRGANGGSPGIMNVRHERACSRAPRMPDINGNNRACSRAPLRESPFSLKPNTIGSFVAGFKSICSKRINILRSTPGAPLWQRNYYEHVIRDEREMNKIRRYIINNPAKWEFTQ